jgi:hypothetical protein
VECGCEGISLGSAGIQGLRVSGLGHSQNRGLMFEVGLSLRVGVWSLVGFKFLS